MGVGNTHTNAENDVVFGEKWEESEYLTVNLNAFAGNDGK